VAACALWAAVALGLLLVPGVLGTLRGFAYSGAPNCGATIAPSCRSRVPVRLEFIDYDVQDTGPPADVAEVIEVVGSSIRQRVEIHADLPPQGVRGEAEAWRNDVTAVFVSGRRVGTNLEPHLGSSVFRAALGLVFGALPVALSALAARRRQRTSRATPAPGG
jgi:hypothetical protein